MEGNARDIRLYSGTSHPKLAESIAKCLGQQLGHVTVERFPDGEVFVQYKDTLRNADAFIIQSPSNPTNENLMELLIAIDALKRASASRINAIIPYYGYSRQDRKDKSRVPITSKLVADLLDRAGADRVVSVDLHADQIQGFFDIPMDALTAQPIIVDHVKNSGYDLDNLVVVAPDVGSVKRSRSLAERLGCPLAIIDKRRPQANVSEVMNVIGDVVGKDVLMIDDMIDTAGTICGAANALKELGAKSITAGCTHPLFNGEAPKRLMESAIDRIIVTDTVPLTEEKNIDKVVVVSIAPLLAKTIDRIHKGKSVSSLFEE